MGDDAGEAASGGGEPIEDPREPGTTSGGCSLTILLAQLLLSIVALVPGQSSEVLGVEIAVLGLALVWLVVRPTLRSGARARWKVFTVSLGIAATLPMLIAGASLLVGAGGGLYWAAAEVVIGFSVAVY